MGFISDLLLPENNARVSHMIKFERKPELFIPELLSATDKPGKPGFESLLQYLLYLNEYK